MLKRLKIILSILLVTAVLNTVVTKALHEFFEHHNETHTCLNKEQTHFHEVESAHLDLICNFSLSTSFLKDFSVDFKETIQLFNKKIGVKFIQLTQNFFHYHFLLRGPPCY